MSTTSTPKLYTWGESGNSYKVRLLASLLDVKLQEIEIDFPGAEHHSPEFLAINPKGTIPTLVNGDHVFTDSAAILIYLAGTYPDAGSVGTTSSWWSTNVVEQAHIVDWLAFTASSIQLGLGAARSILFHNPNGVSDEATSRRLVEAKTKGQKSLEMLQNRLEKEKWLALGRPTIADVAVFVYVALAPSKNSSNPAVR